MGDNLNGIFANMIQGMGFIGCAPNRVYNMAPPDGGGVEATAEGTELTLHSAAAPLTALTLYGKSEQRTTTGAQLFDVSGFPDNVIAKGITIVNNHDGSFTVSGTKTETGGVNLTGGKLTLPAGTYTLSGNTNGLYVVLAYDEGYMQNNVTRTFESETEFQMHIQANEAQDETITIFPMLNPGSNALPWEPYTGGAPSPSPGYPQEIKSVGDSGTVNVTLSDSGSQNQILPVQTPNGLPGIPVSYDGNYTDANGQQWVCDEVDFKRGVYVQRVEEKIIATEDSFNKSGLSHESVNHYSINGLYAFPDVAGEHNTLMSNHFLPGRNQSFGESGYMFQGGADNNIIYFSVPSETFPDAESFKNWAVENGLVVMYKLVTPIETPLSASELAAYAALRTYSPTTVVSNDAGGWMKVGYKATPQPMTMLARKR